MLASKKPRIIELVAKVATMNEDEIRALPEKPDVLKGLLNLHQRAANEQRVLEAERLASMMQQQPINGIAVNDQSCHVYMINLIGDGWIRSGSNLLEIKEGWHWSQLLDGTVWLTNVSITTTAETINDLLSCSRYIGLKTFGEYRDLERDRRNKLAPTFILDL